MKQYLRSFDKKHRNFRINLPSLTSKQKVGLGVFLLASVYSLVQAQFPLPVNVGMMVIKPMIELIGNSSDAIGGVGGAAGEESAAAAFEATKSFISAFMWFEPIRMALSYIVNAQESSISTVASVPFAGSGIFSHISNGITIFACIGCAFKIVTHFLKTERHDNISAIFGYFTYLAPLTLFLFSGQIVSKLSGINRGVNVQSVSSVGNKLNAELEKTIKSDYIIYYQNVKQKTDAAEKAEFMEKIAYKVDIFKDTASALGGNTIKYLYFSFFILVFTSVLAIPAFIMTFMVKVLLSVMIAGAKIVFLLAFIPGFENAWRTYLLNMLNVLLWIPIFNAIITFIVGIIAATMDTAALSTGQIVWLSIVSIVAAFQSISLTTSAANSIINGAGAGMAGAMGSLASMSGAAIGAGALKAGATVAGVAATGGAASSVTASKIASKLSKD